VALGFDRFVAVLDLESGAVVAEHDLGCPFREYVPASGGRLLVLHELGASSLGSDWGIRWDFKRDVVETVTLGDGLLRLTFLDAPDVALSLETGAPIN
jgi:hypothetical protein